MNNFAKFKKASKLFYIIEPIDIDGDKNPDGFLASQYKIDKYGNRIYLKNKYITFENLKQNIIIAQQFKIGGANKKSKSNMIYMTTEEYNKFINSHQQNPPKLIINEGYHQNNHNHNYNPNYPNNPNYNPNYPNNHNYNPNYPNNPNNPNYNPNYPNNPNYNQQNDGQNSFMGNLQSGIGLGIGFGMGDALVDGIFSCFS
jgi:hypothetical protein